MEHRYVVDQELATHQGAQLAKLVCWYKPSEVLKLATADNAELLALSGLRGPDQGKLVVVEEADLLLVDGNLLTDIKLIEDPTKNSLLFMKDGRVYKTLAPDSGATAVSSPVNPTNASATGERGLDRISWLRS